MAAQMQNPGGQAGASRNQLGGWLPFPSIASDRRALISVVYVLMFIGRESLMPKRIDPGLPREGLPGFSFGNYILDSLNGNT